MDALPARLDPEALLRDVGWMQALCRQLVHDSDAAADIAQETWLAALKHPWSGGGPPRAWLTHVARNMARSHVRTDRRRRARETDAHDDRTQSSPADLIARVETQRLLSEAVLALDEPYRTTILLRYVEGLDPSEIARRTDAPAGTVSSRIARGLERLRDELDRRSQGERTRWLPAISVLSRSTRPTVQVVSALGGVVVVKTFTWIMAVALVVAGWWWFGHGHAAPIDSERMVSTPTTNSTGKSAESPAATTMSGPSRASADRAVISTRPTVADHKPLSIRLLDSMTHEPAPHMLATLTGTKATESLESDVEGILHSARIGADEPVELDLSQSVHPSDLLQTQREIAAAIPTSVHVEPTSDTKPLVRDVDVPVGPTYFLRGALPVSTGTFTARMTSADPSMAFDKAFTPVHVDDRTWMRFSPRSRAMSGGPPWKILIGSDDGLWSGSSEVSTNVGICATPLDVRFEPTARVRGTVSVAGSGNAGSQTIQMWKPGASFRDPKNRPVLAATDDEGNFDVRWVAPGSYALKVEAKGHPDFAQDVDVVAGADQRFDVELQPAAPTGNLIIALKSDSGTYAGSVRVHAASEGAHPSIVGQNVAWNAATGAGRAEFPTLERVVHHLDAVAADGTPVSPANITAEPDGRTIEFLVHDRTAMSELLFDVRDVKTNEVVLFERILVRIPGADDPRAVSVDKKTLRTRLPTAPRYSIELRAHGYLPLLTEIAYSADTGPIVLRPKQGFGVEVHAVDGADHDLALVRILLDGHDCGATDAKGLLNVELDAEPTALKAVLQGWHMTDRSDPDPQTGRIRAWMPWLRVVMQRDGP